MIVCTVLFGLYIFANALNTPVDQKDKNIFDVLIFGLFVFSTCCLIIFAMLWGVLILALDIDISKPISVCAQKIIKCCNSEPEDDTGEISVVVGSTQ